MERRAQFPLLLSLPSPPLVHLWGLHWALHRGTSVCMGRVRSQGFSNGIEGGGVASGGSDWCAGIVASRVIIDYKSKHSMGKSSTHYPSSCPGCTASWEMSQSCCARGKSREKGSTESLFSSSTSACVHLREHNEGLCTSEGSRGLRVHGLWIWWIIYQGNTKRASSISHRWLWVCDNRRCRGDCMYHWSLSLLWALTAIATLAEFFQPKSFHMQITV